MKQLNSYKFSVIFLLMISISCNTKVKEEKSTEGTDNEQTEMTSEDNENDETSSNATTDDIDQITVSIEDHKWVLTELMGTAVERNDKTPHFILTSSENTISGNNSCNLFTSSYTLKEGNQIEIGDMINTLMACENMEMSTAFMDMLQKTDNYSLKDGVLSLNKARMAPLARFEMEH